jgi:hypothetical protein
MGFLRAIPVRANEVRPSFGSKGRRLRPSLPGAMGALLSSELTKPV